MYGKGNATPYTDIQFPRRTCIEITSYVTGVRKILFVYFARNEVGIFYQSDADDQEATYKKSKKISIFHNKIKSRSYW